MIATPTIAMHHKPGTYKAYKTMIAQWTIWFLEHNGTLRPADGGKVYAHRQNAYARVSRLNHPIQHVLKKASACEAYHDGYTLFVCQNENEYEDVYTLSIQVGEMPPHFQQDFKTIAEVEEEIRERSAFPLCLDWKAVKAND